MVMNDGIYYFNLIDQYVWYAPYMINKVNLNSIFLDPHTGSVLVYTFYVETYGNIGINDSNIHIYHYIIHTK